MKNLKFLRIGDWDIQIDDIMLDTGYPYLPIQTRAFRSIGCSNYDFKLKVNLNSDYFDISTHDLQIVSEFNEEFSPYILYKKKNGDYLWFLKNNQLENHIIYSITNDWKQWSIIYDNSNTHGNLAFRYFGNIFAYSILNYGGVVFHGVVMEYEGKGIIVSAASGVGKTTHTRMWRDYKKALILNGDRALCRKIDDKYYAYGSPWFGSSGEYINRKVPINAIVLLERGEINQVSKIDKFQGALGLMERVFAPTWDKDMFNKALDYIDDIVIQVPIFKLKCLPNIEAVEVLKNVIDNMEKV